MAKLIYQDPASGQEISVEIGPNFPEVTIGRNPENTIQITNNSISRKHAKVLYNAGQVTLYDLNSSNGCYVNGNRVQSQVLSDGDRIRAGEYPLDFVETVDVELDLVDVQPVSPSYRPAPGGASGGHQLFGPDSYADVDEGLGASASSAGFARARTESAAINHLGAPPAPQQPPQIGSDFYGVADHAYDGGQPQEYDDSLMLDDEDFEEVLGQGAAQPAGAADPSIRPYYEEEDPYADMLDGPGGTDMGIRPYYEDEELEAEDDKGGYFGNMLASQPAPALDADAGGLSDRDDTLNASRSEVARSLFGAQDLVELEEDDADSDTYDAPVEADVAPPAEVRGSGAQPSALAQRELDELRAAVERLEEERTRLIAEIDQNQREPQGAAQRQAERLRADRNRLSEERRNLIRQLKDAHAELDARPQIEELEQVNEQLRAANTSINDLRRELKQTQKERDTRDQTIARLQQEVDTVRADFERLSEQYQALDQEKGDLAGRGDALDSQLASVRKELSDFQERHAQGESIISGLEADLGEVTGQRDELRQELEQARETTAAQAEEIADLQAQRDARDIEIEELTEQESQLEAEIERLNTRVDALVETLDARPTDADVQQLRAQLADTIQQLDETTRERDALLQTRDTLSQEIKQARALLTDFQERLDVVSAERDDYRRERDDLKQEKQAFARETDYLQSNRRKWVEQIEALTEKVNALEADRKKKRGIFAELSADLRSLVQQNDELKAQLAEARASLESGPTSEDVAVKDARIAELKQNLSEARAQVDELEADSSELTRQLGDVALERDALAEEIDALKAEFESATAALEDATQQLAAREEALEEAGDFTQEREALTQAHQEALDAVTAERDDLLEQVEALAIQLADAENPGGGDGDDALRQRVRELEAELTDRETMLAELILARDQLEDQLKSQVN